MPSRDYTEGTLSSQEVRLEDLEGGVPLQVLEEERGRGDLTGNCTKPQTSHSSIKSWINGPIPEGTSNPLGSSLSSSLLTA